MREDGAMTGAGVSWSEFSAAAPEIARAGQRLVEEAPGVPGVAFLATVGVDGRPRLHPFVPAVVRGGLWAFVVRSPKQRDLDRDGGYAIHSVLGAHDESFFVSGRAIVTNDEARRAVVGAAMPFDGIDDNHILYEFRIDRALWTEWTTPTTPVHHRWRVTLPGSLPTR
jgi:hypothetical protein